MKVPVKKADPKKVKALLEVDETAELFVKSKKMEKDVKSQTDELKGQLRDQVKSCGTVVAGGHTVVETDKYVVTNQLRTTRKLDVDRARALLKSKKLLNVVERTETVTHLDEDEILHLVEIGKISDKEFATIMSKSTTEALLVKESK